MRGVHPLYPQEHSMQNELHTAAATQTSTEVASSTPPTKTAPVELHPSSLQHVAGGLTPNSSWATPNSSW
jgi:hypothetical protein